MEELIESAEKYYTSDITYHNFSHVEDTLEAAEELIGRCNEHNVELDEDVVYAALMFHDAYYQKNAERFGFDTKEDVSKDVARKELREHGYEEEFVEQVVGCIEATKHSATPQTNEQVAVRASDLRGLKGEKEEFLANTEALWEEQKILSESEPNYQQWVEGTLNALLNYWWQDLELTPEHDTDDGYSEFHIELGQNIREFKEEYVTDNMQIEVNAETK